MRFVVYGAGAIGGLVGARLFERRHEVVLIARGAHRSAIELKGLAVGSPAGTTVWRTPVVGHPRDVDVSADTVVVLATKSQDTPDALRQLAAAAPPSVPIVLLQNGVDNERAALRLFERVYGGYVVVPAVHLDPGAVLVFSGPVAGVLDIGRYPAGIDALASALAGAFTDAGFDSRAEPDIMRWKYAKLVSNLANAANAVCGPGTRWGRLGDMVREEGADCLRAAGIDFVNEDEESARWRDSVEIRPVDGQEYPGGSTWQSLRRSTGSVESEYLNGEIVLLGRLHGVHTPVNSVLLRLATEMARDRRAPGALSAEEVIAIVDAERLRLGRGRSRSRGR
jgi:2-dehydropantoate 2-reductase